MYVFVTLEKIISFLNHFNIDITLLSPDTLSIVVLLSNILVLLFYIFLFIVLYKIVFLIKDAWFSW